MKLGELKLGELLDTPPPGLDEAIAISKVLYIYSLILLLIFFVSADSLSKGVHRSFNSWNHLSITCSLESCLILHQL